MTGPTGSRVRLGFHDAIAIIIGTVIGAGIYETTPLIAASSRSAAEVCVVFLLGGLCAVIGALCYAELASVLKRTGGDFEYLHEAYGSRVAFLFAWMTFWVVQPAGVGAIAYIFARYATEWHAGLGPDHFAALAAFAVAGLTAANSFGLQVGAQTQKLLTALKVLGILVLVATGFSLADVAGSVDDVPVSPGSPNGKLAFILVMYTYGGWNVIVLMAAEIETTNRNLLRALLVSLAVIAVIYILTVLSFEFALGHARLGASGSAASDVANMAFGATGKLFISALICITCLANINATLMTNSRIFVAFGRRWSTFDWLGQWHGRHRAPVNALLAQGVIAIVLIFALASGAESFTRLVIFSAPVFWLFFLLVSIALFILRARGFDTPGAFRVPLYPVLPLVFTGICIFMLHASATYAWATFGVDAIAVVGLFLVGVVASFLSRGRIADPVREDEFDL